MQTGGTHGDPLTLHAPCAWSAMSEEEARICCYELRRRGWRYTWLGGSSANGYWVLARKSDPRTHVLHREQPIMLRTLADCAAYLRLPLEPGSVKGSS